MTPEQQHKIRAELAQRMGYSVLPVGTPNHWHYQLRLPDASKYQRWRETESEAWADAPDPFRSAEDKDALVAWIGAQGVNCRTKFIKHLARSIKIESGVLEGWSLLSAHEESSADWSDFFLLLTAPLETITLCAYIAVTGDRTYGI